MAASRRSCTLARNRPEREMGTLMTSSGRHFESNHEQLEKWFTYLSVSYISGASFERAAHGHTAGRRRAHGRRDVIPSALRTRTLFARVRCRVCVGLAEAHAVTRAHVAIVAAKHSYCPIDPQPTILVRTCPYRNISNRQLD